MIIRRWAILDCDMRHAELLASLRGCLQRELSGDAAVLFSGGLDSALLAFLGRPYASLSLYTVGFPGCHDLEAGRRGAEELGLPWEAVMLDEGVVRQGVAFLRSHLGLEDPVTISFELPLYFACSSLHQNTLLSGQGADELFAGYARYSSMGEKEKERALQDDLERLLAVGAPRESLLADMFGKKMVCPYLCKEAVRAARAFSAGELTGLRGNKMPLRRLASELGLSAATAPKKAAQYGSGVMAAMKRMASEDGAPLGKWVAEAE